MKTISHYRNLFSKLRRDNKNGRAPHKPVLLLAIIRLIHKGEILTNAIEISPELISEFKSVWSKLVISNHTCNFALPFFHMRSEPFWTLISKPGMSPSLTSSNSIKSFKNLRTTIACAEIEKELFDLLLNATTRTFLEEGILEHYFFETKKQYFTNTYDLFSQIEGQLVTEDSPTYQARMEVLKANLNEDEYEEEIFVRSGVFKREIPKLYDFQCAISGMRITASINAQMIDACHIVPFAHSKDDTISNGLSLSPNLHRAFDRGLISISDDYLVQVSPGIVESDSPYSIRQFEGRRIHLPNNMKHFPSQRNLAWHRSETFVI